MKKIRAYVDRLACIFPFEEEYFRSHGVNATFVGHPLFDELPADRTSARGVLLRRLNARTSPPAVGIIPGSRRSRSKANLPHLIEVMHAIAREFPQVKFLVPTTARRTRS